MIIYHVNEEFNKVLGTGEVTVSNIVPKNYGQMMTLKAPNDKVLKLMFNDPTCSEEDFDFEDAALVSLRVYSYQIRYGTCYFVTAAAEFINPDGEVCIVRGEMEHVVDNVKSEDKAAAKED